MTETSGLIRSCQLWIFFGFPLRTTNETIESVTIPLYLPRFQPLETTPALTRSFMSAARDRSTTSAGRPLMIARVWSPDAPYDCVKLTSLPAGVAWNAGMIDLNASLGVE